MEIEAALAYLDRLSREDTRPIPPSLDTIAALCSALGDPQHTAPVIHVTGTNGKGSVVEMISRLLVADGLTVGAYTSPHVDRVNARLARNDEPIGDDELAEQIAAIAAVERLVGRQPSAFEALTAAAFRWFADLAVDVMVVEVGMLGRWDATNVADARVAVVTNVGPDHTDLAGPSLTDVALEKAGIVTPHSAVVIGEARQELVEIFRTAGGAAVLVRDDDFGVVGSARAVGGRLLDLRTPTTIYTDVFLPLHGAHQADNAALALTAVETFFASPLPTDVVEEAFAAVVLPGRFEVVGRQPLVVVDGASNQPAADACAETFFDDFEPEGHRLLVVGTTRDPGEMLAALRADDFDSVLACPAPSPNGRAAADVASAARAMGCDDVVAFDSVAAACQQVIGAAAADDAILVTGCMEVAASARRVVHHLLP